MVAGFSFLSYYVHTQVFESEWTLHFCALRKNHGLFLIHTHTVATL